MNSSPQRWVIPQHRDCTCWLAPRGYWHGGWQETADFRLSAFHNNKRYAWISALAPQSYGVMLEKCCPWTQGVDAQDASVGDWCWWEHLGLLLGISWGHPAAQELSDCWRNASRGRKVRGCVEAARCKVLGTAASSALSCGPSYGKTGVAAG